MLPELGICINVLEGLGNLHGVPGRGVSLEECVDLVGFLLGHEAHGAVLDDSIEQVGVCLGSLLLKSERERERERERLDNQGIDTDSANRERQ